MAEKSVAKGKTKVKVVVTQKKAEATLYQTAGEYSKLLGEVELITALPVFAALDEKKKELLGELDSNFEPAEKGKIPVEDAEVSYSVKKASNSIDDEGKKKVIELLGMDAFIAMASLSIKQLKDYLSKKDYDQIVTIERTGARTIKVKRFIK